MVKDSSKTFTFLLITEVDGTMSEEDIEKRALQDIELYTRRIKHELTYLEEIL